MATRQGAIVSLRTRIPGDGHINTDDQWGFRQGDDEYDGDYGVGEATKELREMFGEGRDNIVIDEQGNAFFYGRNRAITPLSPAEREQLEQKYGDRILRAHTPTSGMEQFPGGAGAAAALAVLAAGGMGLFEQTGIAHPDLLNTGVSLPDPSIFADGVVGPDAFASEAAAQAAGYGTGMTEVTAATASQVAQAAQEVAKGTPWAEIFKKYGPKVAAAVVATVAAGGASGGGGSGSGSGSGSSAGDYEPRQLDTEKEYFGDVATYEAALASVPDPTPEEIEITGMQLSLARRGIQAGKDLETEIMRGFGVKRDINTGMYRKLNEEEYLAGLNEAQRGIYELQMMDIERSKRAMRGEIVSEALRQQKDREYDLLKEKLARAGHRIEGDAPGTAIATSTAGAQNLGVFNERYALAEDAERSRQINEGTGRILGRQGMLENIDDRGRARSQALIGYSNNFFNQARGLSPLFQPYQFHRGLQTQTNIANAAAQNRARAHAADASNRLNILRGEQAFKRDLYNTEAFNKYERERLHNQQNIDARNAMVDRQNKKELGEGIGKIVEDILTPDN